MCSILLFKRNTFKKQHRTQYLNRFLLNDSSRIFAKSNHKLGKFLVNIVSTEYLSLRVHSLKRTLLLISLFLITLHPPNAIADTPAGQAGAFLRMGIGARAIGMGNALTGLARDGFSGYYNPASLPFMQQPELAFSLGILPLDRKQNFIGFSTYLQPKSKTKDDSTKSQPFRGGIAFGWIHAGISDIDGRDSDGNHIGMFSNSENAFFASFALQPKDYIGIGLTVKVVQNKLPELEKDDGTLSANGLGFDIGLFSAPMENLTVGFVVKDIGTKYTWDTENVWERGSKTINEFPTYYRMGAAYQIQSETVVSADAEFNEEQGWRLYLGGERRFQESFIARAGYNSDRLTFGLGFTFNFWKYEGELDYAYDTISITPSAEQHISWRIIF